MKHLQWIGAGFLAAAFLVAGAKAWGAHPAQANPAYTRPEYNAYLAAHLEGNPAKKIKLLDDFVGKYPASTLLVEAYQDFAQGWQALDQWRMPANMTVGQFATQRETMGKKFDVVTQIAEAGLKGQKSDLCQGGAVVPDARYAIRAGSTG
jgi:hypothetical protein